MIARSTCVWDPVSLLIVQVVPSMVFLPCLLSGNLDPVVWASEIRVLLPEVDKVCVHSFQLERSCQQESVERLMMCPCLPPIAPLSLGQPPAQALWCHSTTRLVLARHPALQPLDLALLHFSLPVNPFLDPPWIQHQPH